MLIAFIVPVMKTALEENGLLDSWMHRTEKQKNGRVRDFTFVQLFERIDYHITL